MNDWFKLVDIYWPFRMLSTEVEKSHFVYLIPYVTEPQNRMITDHITREFYGLIVHFFSRYISRKFGYTCLQQMRASWLAVSSTAWLSCRNSREKRLKRHLRYYYTQLVRRRRSFVRLLSAELEFVYCKKSISIQGTSYAFCK